MRNIKWQMTNETRTSVGTGEEIYVEKGVLLLIRYGFVVRFARQRSGRQDWLGDERPIYGGENVNHL